MHFLYCSDGTFDMLRRLQTCIFMSFCLAMCSAYNPTDFS